MARVRRSSSIDCGSGIDSVFRPVFGQALPDGLFRRRAGRGALHNRGQLTAEIHPFYLNLPGFANIC